jgi:hypothetical protein
LLQQFASLDVLDYRHTKVEEPKPAIKQAIAAKRIQ